MNQGKTIADMRAENPNFDRDLDRTFHMAENSNKHKVDDLIAEYFKLKDWHEAESKRFDAHCKPVRARMDELTSLLLGLMNEQGVESFKTDHGTAYKSTIVTPGIEDRDKYLDFVFDNWDEIGNALLQLGAPKKEAVKEWMDVHNGMLPPGVKSSSFVYVNVRRS